MFTSPARVETIAPSATISSGADSARVSPQRPGLRMLPSISAVNTFRHGPPVTAISSADRASATAMART